MKSLGLGDARKTSVAIPGDTLAVKLGWEHSHYPYFPSLKPQEKAAISIDLLIEHFRDRGGRVEKITSVSKPGDLLLMEDGVEKLIEVKVGVETFSAGPNIRSSSFWFNQIRNDGCDYVILMFASPSHFVSFQFEAMAIRRLSSFKPGHVGSDTLFEVKAVFNSASCSISELRTHGRLIDIVEL